MRWTGSSFTLTMMPRQASTTTTSPSCTSSSPPPSPTTSSQSAWVPKASLSSWWGTPPHPWSVAGAECASTAANHPRCRRWRCLMWIAPIARGAAAKRCPASCSALDTAPCRRMHARGTAADPTPPSTRTPGSLRASSAGERSAPRRASTASTHASPGTSAGFLTKQAWLLTPQTEYRPQRMEICLK